MRYRYIGIIGATLIATVVALSALMYYLNQDKCPLGTFQCRNSTICMLQRSWCNSIMDCPEGDDEIIEKCFDWHGNWDWIFKKRKWDVTVTCEKSDCAVNCTCNDCHVNCTGYNSIPRGLSVNITIMTLTNNTIAKVPKDSLLNYQKIQALYLDDNEISQLEKGAFINQKELIWLVLKNNRINEIQPGHFTGLISLETLRANGNRVLVADLSDFENSTTLEFIDLSKNLLTTPNLTIPYLPVLEDLILDENLFESITENMFANLPELRSLNMQQTQLRTIHPNAFRNLAKLTELNLSENKIVTISPNLFQPIQNLTKLLIGYNPIEKLSVVLFDPLKNLRSLGVEGIDMDDMEKNVFDVFSNLNFVYFKKFHYCTTYAPKVQMCQPVSDGVSSLSNLLGKPLLRVVVWGISCVTCLGNALVLWGRFTAKDENHVLSIVIRNLAVSDMLMGIYLFIIAVEDIRFRDNYNKVASTWMSSWPCTLTGMLAMTSSEVSVLILSFMSVERFLLIAAPLKGHRPLTPRSASSIMILIWIIGIVLAFIPAIHWRSSTRFYGVNGLCFPLHIDDPFLIGWEYSAFIFLGLNLLGLIIIAYVYMGMFASIWKTRHGTPLSVGDSEFALRFFLIVLTDAACWAPIIALKILAFLKYPVPPDLHAWVVVFILPVNSAVNPLLYTFTTPKFRERLSNKCFSRIQDIVTKRHSTEDSQVSNTYGNKNIILPVLMLKSGGDFQAKEGKVSSMFQCDDREYIGTHSHIL